MGKFFIAFMAIFFFLILCFGITAGGGIAINNGEEEIGIVLVALGVLGFLVGLIPLMQWLAGRLFNFAGEGTAVSEATLRQTLHAIPTKEIPVMVEDRGKKIVVTWNYVDATWWNVLSKSGLQKLYELHIKLNDETKTATLIDVQKSIEWRAGPTQVRLRGGYSRGVDFNFERMVAFGWDDAFQFGKVVDYKFKNSDLKNPVVNLLTENGWRVKFGLW